MRYLPSSWCHHNVLPTGRLHLTTYSVGSIFYIHFTHTNIFSQIIVNTIKTHLKVAWLQTLSWAWHFPGTGLKLWKYVKMDHQLIWEFQWPTQWSACDGWPEYRPLIGQRQDNTGLWLVGADHVTWILASDWLFRALYLLCHIVMLHQHQLSKF